MNINEVYETKSNYLKASDLKGKRINVTIEEATVEDIGTDRKVVLSFEKAEKKLVLNKTNARMIQDLFDAADTREWLGREITLRPDKTTYQGDLVDCIRVDSILPEHNQPVVKKPQIKPADEPEWNPSDDDAPDDEQIPF